MTTISSGRTDGLSHSCMLAREVSGSVGPSIVMQAVAPSIPIEEILVKIASVRVDS